jgi:hypothetical protein
VAKKKAKKKTFRAAKAVKEIARHVIGSPPPTKPLVPKTKQTREKHKPSLGDLMCENH